MIRITSRQGLSLAASLLATASMQAHAQSTASQIEETELEEVVVTAQRLGGHGLMQAEEAAKAKTTITGEYLTSQAAGQSVFQSLNLVPGLNFTNNDAYGSSGGNVRMRSFDNSRISMMVDGIQLNDSGNYALYSNQMVDPELLERATVNLGTTDVDSPTASATGGTINLQMARPTTTAQLLLQPSVGSEDYSRIFLRGDSGEIGPLGTRALVAFSNQVYDKFIGVGKQKRMQINTRVYQPLAGEGDFVSLAGSYNKGRSIFMRNISLRNWWARDFSAADNVDTCTQPTPGPGAQAAVTSCTGTYYRLATNPSNTGNLRGQLSLGLTDRLRFTFDPSFQYVLANGGSNTALDEDADRRLLGATGVAGVNGIDLNGDGDILDTVVVFRPNNTNTRRYGINSSLIYSLGDTSRLRFGYTLDRAWHRQTGQMGYTDVNSNPQSVFAGRKADAIPTVDGEELRRRDRKSIALLNQLSLSFTTRFAEDRGGLSLGVRAPFFERELNQYCYTPTGRTAAGGTGGDSPSGDPYCTTAVATPVPGTDYVTLAGRAGAPTVATLYTYLPPYARKVKYDKLLPNAGVSFRPWDDNQLYLSFSQGLSAPRTDVLYNLEIPGVRPETTDNLELGWRYTTSAVLASAAVWKTDYKNRIVSAWDEDLQQSTDRNVGKVALWGLDGSIGVEPVKNLFAYVTASYTKSDVKGDLPLSATLTAPTRGKELVETPDYTLGGRIEYEFRGLRAGFQGKFVSDRWITDVNDLKAPPYAVFDADIRYAFNLMGQSSFLQLNVLNLFDREYLGSLSTTTCSVPAAYCSNSSVGGNVFGYLGSPRTVQLSWQMVLGGGG